MKIESEHNDIKFGDKCWAWDCNESAGSEYFFMAYVEGSRHPVKVIKDDGVSVGFRHFRPLKTEAEKVLDAFEGQKICMGEGISRYIIPHSIDNRGRLECRRDDGATIYLNGVHFDDWKLWTAPKVVLDTRRVAGMWCARAYWNNLHQVQAPSLDGGSCKINGERVNLMGEDPARQFSFSKDPMKPIDQWKTLEEICREAQA